MIHDISPLISPEIAVFPGDVTFQRPSLLDFSKGDHLRLSSIQGTLHLGAHADAPSHYHPLGQTMEQCELDTYYGPCQVIDVSAFKGEITAEQMGNIKILAPRVLFRTDSILDVNQWQDDFSFLAPELVESLAGQGVRLIGIDTPSMDHSASKGLDSHQAFYRNKVFILEGLVLKNISAGVYTLVAFPLKLKGAEASPVRAVLIDDQATI